MKSNLTPKDAVNRQILWRATDNQ